MSRPLVVLLLNLLTVSMASQSALLNEHAWKVELGNKWDVLGPFPIHAREQHYLSPSFPLNLSEPIDFNKSWPSSYADRGQVSWSVIESDINGTLKVSFPNIRWGFLRATEGWAALQHHAVLRGTIKVYPSPLVAGYTPVPTLRINLIQGAFFTIVPTLATERQFFVPEWHTGNIYDMERALPRSVKLPAPPDLNKPTIYHIFISGDYEIRLFGDPAVNGHELPIQIIRLFVELEYLSDSLIHEASQDVMCNFVDGYAFGNAVGIALRSTSEWWTVTNASVRDVKGVALNIHRDTVIAPSQTRIVPLLLTQSCSFNLPELRVDLSVVSSNGATEIVTIKIPVNHRSWWTHTSYEPIKATYFYAVSMPVPFLVVPPVLSNQTRPPILALHGAGVDIFEQPFWAQSIPRNTYSWLVFPSALTSWGLDWHGPSAQNAWATIDALYVILQSNEDWKPWEIGLNTQVLVMGHSNGGQGSWYLASRYPDRVLGVIPAAAYIKSQCYVPWTMSRSAHYMDPALRAILESSLTPDDNDLHLSNLVDIPVLAIHGGSDTNVPPWHSREAVSILRTLGSKNVNFKEDIGKDHWYPSVFDNQQVTEFLNRILESPTQPSTVKEFTLTVSDPAASGSLHGWRIESLLLPGRLAKLHIKVSRSGYATVVTLNVQTFSIHRHLCACHSVQITGNAPISIPPSPAGLTFFTMNADNGWQVADNLLSLQRRFSASRVQSILSSSGPLVFIVSNETDSGSLSIALRLAHDLQTYLRLDSEIMSDSKAKVLLETQNLPLGNLVFIGDSSSPFAQLVLAKNKTPFQVKGSVLEFNGYPLDDSNTGSLFLHPNPDSCGTSGLMLFIMANSRTAIERMARLFPIRTGIAVPSWVVMGSLSDTIGAAGIQGAGVWSQDWDWNEALSMWMY